MTFAPDLSGRVALVAGGTRGAGRGTSIELGAAGATVYVTGRTTRAEQSPMARPETIEETAELVEAAGGTGIAVRVDHAEDSQVAALMETIRERHGRLDVLVNDIWGADSMMEWEGPFWTQDLENGFRVLRQAVDTHLRTSWHAAPLLLES
ncbi:MAG: SDR family NAD(P)-dependent oxidoreductase, partial [Actinomycetota bacterium]